MLAQQALHDAIQEVDKHLPGRHDQKAHAHHIAEEIKPKKGDKIVLHGTASTNLQAILKDGLTAQFSDWGDEFDYNQDEEQPGRVFVTTDKQFAEDFGAMRAEEAGDDGFIVLAVEVPKGAKLRRDRNVGRSYYYESVPPEWIRGYSLFKFNSNMPARESDAVSGYDTPGFELIETKVIKSIGDAAYIPLRLSALGSVDKHLPGRHDQKEHGRKTTGKVDIQNATPKEAAEIRKLLGSLGEDGKLPSAVFIDRDGELLDSIGAVLDNDTIAFNMAKIKEAKGVTGTLPYNLAHEVGHLVAIKYPTMLSRFTQKFKGTSEYKFVYGLMKGYKAATRPEEVFVNMYAASHAVPELTRKNYPDMYNFFMSKTEKHLPGRHDQKTHGRPGEGPVLDYSALPAQAKPVDKRKFAAAVEDRYKNDVRFKTLADALLLYTQGTFSPIIDAAKAIASNKIDAWAIDEAKRRSSDPKEYLAGTGFLEMYGGIGTNYDLFGKDRYGNVTTRDALNQATVVMDAIAASPLTETPLYRGDTYLKWFVDDALEGKAEKQANREIATQKKRVQEVEEGLKTEEGRKYYEQRDLDDAIGRLDSAKRSLVSARQFQKTVIVGEEFDVPVLSFSHEERIGIGFAEGRVKGTRGRIDEKRERAILYTLVGKHNGLNVSLFSPYRQSESLVGGRFKVKSVKNDWGTIKVELEQVGRYATSKPSG